MAVGVGDGNLKPSDARVRRTQDVMASEGMTRGRIAVGTELGQWRDARRP